MTHHDGGVVILVVLEPRDAVGGVLQFVARHPVTRRTATLRHDASDAVANGQVDEQGVIVVPLPPRRKKNRCTSTIRRCQNLTAVAPTEDLSSE